MPFELGKMIKNEMKVKLSFVEKTVFDAIKSARLTKKCAAHDEKCKRNEQKAEATRRAKVKTENEDADEGVEMDWEIFASTMNRRSLNGWTWLIVMII